MHRKEKAKRRFPKGQLMRLENGVLPALLRASSSMKPDQVFNYTWASEILDKVISEVEKECYSTGKIIHWKVFRAKILTPIMNKTQSPWLKDICKKYGVDNEDKASNMIVTVKRCFRRTLEEHLRLYVRSDSEIEDELNELFTIISKGGAR